MARALLVAALLAGLTIRLACALALERPLVSDETDYDRLGWTLATTGAYADEGRPTAYRPVGYPAFVASVYAIAGRSPRAVRVVQAILDAGTAFLLFVALRRRSRRAAVGAAALWAFYPPAVATATLVYPETLFGFLLVLAAVLLLEEPAYPVGYRVGLGILLGALAMVKVAAPALALLLPWFVLRGPRRWRRAATIAAGMLLVLLPWVVRNQREVGLPVLATSAASNLLIGNHPGATGGYEPDVPEAMRPRAATEAGRARESEESAMRYIADGPLQFFARIPARWAHLLMGEGELAVFTFHAAPRDPATGYREKVREVGAPRLLLLWLPYAFVLLLGAAGLLAREPDALGGFFVTLLAAWLVAHGVTFGGGRHHAPWMPFLVAFAAERLARAPGRRPLEGARLAAWLGLASLCVGLWLLEGALYL
jgi:4-amino-4-deoxy-L-arabinose transferase-like glycosyltransferase